MRQLWEKPNMNLIMFEVNDVITTSSETGLGKVESSDTLEGSMTLDDFLNGKF